MTTNLSKVKTTPKPDNFNPTPIMIDGGLRCRAWSPRQGRQCRNRASRATGKTCRFHGSAGGRPATHARFSLLGKLQKLAATIDDGDIFNLYSEAIVSNIRVEELLQRIADEQALPLADELRKLADQAFIAGVRGDRDKCLSALTELKEALEPIKAEQESWNEIRQHLALSE